MATSLEARETCIAHQHCTLNGQYCHKENVQQLHISTVKTQGENSFDAEATAFLCEWFSSSPTVEVQTSGSTGTPKKYAVEKEKMIQSAIMTLDFLNLQVGDTALLCMPVRYIAGKMMLVRALVGGLSISTTVPSARPLQHIDTSPCFLAITPMQLYETLQYSTDRAKLQTVRQTIVGGGAISAEIEQEIVNFPHPIWSTYGMTETLSHIAVRALNGRMHSDYYQPLKGVSLKTSTAGTLTITAPHLCAETLITNDLVYFDKQGRFKVIGRIDNTINTGGIKVQIEEIEALLNTCPVPLLISAVPHKKLGEAIVLLIEGEETPALHILLQTLPRYWQPKYIFSVPALPFTPTGKPDRKAARKIAETLYKHQ